MYNLVRDITEPLASQSFSNPVLKFFPKTFRSKIDFFRYNQLPPIKEEEGNVSGSEIELRNISLCSDYVSNGSRKRCFELEKAGSNYENGTKKLIDAWRRGEEPLGRPSPSVNVNCLMNMDVKQQQPIWKTAFGKRLIYGRAAILETMSLPSTTKTTENDETLKNNPCSKSVNSSRFPFCDKNTQLADGSSIAQTKRKTEVGNMTASNKAIGIPFSGARRQIPEKKEPVRVQKKARKVEEQKKVKKRKSPGINREKLSCKSALENKPSIETPLKADLSFSKSMTDSLTRSSASRNPNLLSEYVKDILSGSTSHYSCEDCDEIFSNVEELNSHKMKHESERQTCVICNKVYNKPNEFIQHLLTHESVDKFSCKKCKKYFPSLKKYKTHCKNTHSKSDESKKKISLEVKEKLALKYECKRCHLEFDSDENYRAHKKNHIRLDLLGAYLLSSENI